jgi:hypothetical protein
MESDSGPVDGVVTPALLAKAIEEIQQSTEVDGDVLLATLLCAAWPSRPAQNQ